MDSLEFNKIAAGLLLGLLLAIGIGKLGNILYAPDLPEHALVETDADAHSDADVGGGHDEAEDEVPLAMLLANADLEAGEGHFRKCKSCHTVEAGGSNGTGPNIYGIVGAAVEHNGEFGYSGALPDAADVWSFENLDAFLADPKGFAPGTKMTFRGISDAEDRADLIAWLNTQSDAPLDLPAVEEPAAMEEDTMDEGAAEEDMHGDTVDETIGTASDMVEEMAEDAGETMDDGMDAAEDMMDDAGDAMDSAAEMVEDAGDGMGDASGVEAMIAAASVEDGEGVARKCKSCHTFDEGDANRVGPNLWDIVDRPVASIDDYSYSDAMTDYGGVWDYDRLWAYLQDPKGEVPGTKMGFRGITDEEDLAALMAYLHSLSNDPAPLAGSE